MCLFPKFHALYLMLFYVVNGPKFHVKLLGWRRSNRHASTVESSSSSLVAYLRTSFHLSFLSNSCSLTHLVTYLLSDILDLRRTYCINADSKPCIVNILGISYVSYMYSSGFVHFITCFLRAKKKKNFSKFIPCEVTW